MTQVEVETKLSAFEWLQVAVIAISSVGYLGILWLIFAALWNGNLN